MKENEGRERNDRGGREGRKKKDKQAGMEEGNRNFLDDESVVAALSLIQWSSTFLML